MIKFGVQTSIERLVRTGVMTSKTGIYSLEEYLREYCGITDQRSEVFSGQQWESDSLMTFRTGTYIDNTLSSYYSNAGLLAVPTTLHNLFVPNESIRNNNLKHTELTIDRQIRDVDNGLAANTERLVDAVYNASPSSRLGKFQGSAFGGFWTGSLSNYLESKTGYLASENIRNVDISNIKRKIGVDTFELVISRYLQKSKTNDMVKKVYLFEFANNSQSLSEVITINLDHLISEADKKDHMVVIKLGNGMQFNASGYINITGTNGNVVIYPSNWMRVHNSTRTTRVTDEESTGKSEERYINYLVRVEATNTAISVVRQQMTYMYRLVGKENGQTNYLYDVFFTDDPIKMNNRYNDIKISKGVDGKHYFEILDYDETPTGIWVYAPMSYPGVFDRYDESRLYTYWRSVSFRQSGYSSSAVNSSHFTRVRIPNIDNFRNVPPQYESSFEGGVKYPHPIISRYAVKDNVY